MERMHWQDGLISVIGIWLVVAVFVLNVTPPEGVTLTGAIWNFVLVGAVIAALAGAAFYAFRQWEEWILMLLGLWLVVSPWVLGFAEVSQYMTAAVVSGLVILVVAGGTVLWSGGSKQG